ncbi:ArpU family transcriptional regulator [Bacillus sonorensis]|uniref:ArpU family phage packaging/lysis transcriptional regulator n=1 Tax=Bacillus sonorensis TaxID=119858 RepID=UPI0022809411|nr:ArpU family phage packaging/lysis transcriptional regulator [Bacillus sonorensis]MCY7855133.1 ArpU family transcriptional regulator [Bacillus sonorensis]MEC1441471.1 ArpU family phage packaging/lysis transcriptional regulator [Bacillus sonorensis]MEC1536085.1 ArpU family phage packaging/lysis transcriptional regulator [Bacillus sonorensis]
MSATQLAFLPSIDEKEVRNTIIRELKRYKALKVQLENWKEREATGMTDLFPRLRDPHSFNELKVSQMDRALKQSLDDDELKIIKAKYLSSKKIKDIEIYMEMGLKKDKYYQIKRQAIYNLATALGII